MSSTPVSPVGNFGPQAAAFQEFLRRVTQTRGPIHDDWRRQTARRWLTTVDRKRLQQLQEQAIDAAEAARRDKYNPEAWARGAALTAAEAIDMFGTEREAFEQAIVAAAWAIIIEDLMSDEAAELYAAVAPSLPRL